MAPWQWCFCWRHPLFLAPLNLERFPINVKAQPHPDSAPTVADDHAPAPSAQLEAGPDHGAGLSPEASIPPQQEDEGFPDRPGPRVIGRHGLQQLDLLMTTLEALDFRGSEVMVASLQQKDAAKVAVDRVEFWKWRTTNPLRRTMRRTQLKQAQVMAMVSLVCDTAARFYPVLYQLVSVREDPSLAEARWTQLTKRLQDLLQQRMNPRRATMEKFADHGYALAMAKQMVRALVFSAGPGGEQRLLASLQDGMPRSRYWPCTRFNTRFWAAVSACWVRGLRKGTKAPSQS